MAKITTHTILMTGFMGSGKSEVARRLAGLLGRQMYDLDHVITNHEGRTPAQLIVEDGEQTFRDKETRALRDQLENRPGSVIALGGGAWIQTPNRELIKAAAGISVWLNTPFELCWKRIENSGEERPLGKDRQKAIDLFQLRLPTYQLADIHIESDAASSSEELAKQVIKQLSIR